MKILLYFTLILTGFITASCDNSRDDESSAYPWPVSTPAAEGMNPVILDSAFITAEQLGFVDGLVVIKNGSIIAEDYYNGNNRNSSHQIYSDTKSFISALIGIALRDGLIDSLDKKVMDYFPEYVYSGIDSRFFDITIRHLLTMRMGIDAEENNLIPILSTNDWIKETFKLPLLYNPGQRFSYNSLETHLLSAIITKTSGMNALKYGKTHLTSLMDIDIDRWGQDPLGNNNGGFDIYMKPRDMAVFGYLYLHGGKWNDTQIEPEAWVEASLTKTWVNDGHAWGVLTDYNYGYLWWIGKINGYDLFMALGMGGQYIIVFPELELIVVTTANKDISWDNQQELPILELVSKNILRAIQKY